MTSPDHGTQGKPSNEHEFLVYAGGPAADYGDGDPVEEQVAFRRKRVDEQALEKVTLSPAELDRLRGQAEWIAAGLQGPARGSAQDFVVDEVTLHVGLSATGHFFFVGGSVEAAVDITWRRRGA